MPRLEFRETAGSTQLGASEGDNDWIVVNIPAPRNDVTTVMTSLPRHDININNEEDEVRHIWDYQFFKTRPLFDLFLSFSH